MKRKTFNAVKFMRDTRDELSAKYLNDPATQEKDLAQIRKKYIRLRGTSTKRQSKSTQASI